MKNRLFIGGLMCLLSASLIPLSAGEETESLSMNIEALLLVSDPREAGDRLVAWVEERGGYYIYQSGERVVLRFPNGATPELTQFLEEFPRGNVVSLTTTSRRLAEEIRQARSAIAARREILEKNLSYLSRSDVKGTLAIEEEVTRLILELEQHRGRLGRLLSEERYGTAEISLNFRGTTLPEDIPSSFEWINELGLYQFLEDTP